MAVTLMLVFLYKNGFWLKSSPEKLYDLALSVANSMPRDKETVVSLIKKVFIESITEQEQTYLETKSLKMISVMIEPR